MYIIIIYNSSITDTEHSKLYHIRFSILYIYIYIYIHIYIYTYIYIYVGDRCGG